MISKKLKSPRFKCLLDCRIGYNITSTRHIVYYDKLFKLSKFSGVMMNMQYEDVIKLIKEKSSLSDDEIKSKIDAKLNQLSGLISKEGAAHIIANELGINFNEVEKKLKIDKILAGMRNVETVGKVVQKYEVREFNSSGREGKVANLLLGDETGTIRVVFWNDQVDKFTSIEEGMTLKISSGYARANNNRPEIHLNDQSKVEINPSGEVISDIKSGPSFQRKKVSELNESDENIEIFGTIVQAFEPRFFEVDPSTGRRTRPASDGKFYGADGNEIKPDYSYVFNIFFDDGTDNVRVVCFRNQMQSLLKKAHEDILTFKDNLSLFESTKHDLLGKMVKIQGRVAKNEMFDRIEVVASRIFPEPNPDEEIKKMESSSMTSVNQNDANDNNFDNVSSETKNNIEESNGMENRNLESSNTGNSLDNIENLSFDNQDGTDDDAMQNSTESTELDGDSDLGDLESDDKPKRTQEYEGDDLESLDDMEELEDLDDTDDL